MIKDVRFNNPRSDVRAESIIEEKTVGAAERSRSLWFLKSTLNLAFTPDTLTIPELEQSKAAVLNTLASVHSRRCYASAIDRFIAWHCSEPRLTFNRAVVVRYRSHLEGLSLYASTINSHLSAIRRLADESAESGWLTPQMAIGIRRVQGVKRLGRKIGNWLSRSQAEELVNAASKTDLRGWRDGAIVGLLLGCGLRRSEVVGLTLEQLQIREGRWVIVDLIGKGRRLRTVPVPSGPSNCWMGRSLRTRNWR